MLTIFGHSKARKDLVNHVSKGTFVIFLRRIIRMWCKTLFTIVWLQILLFYAEPSFWIFFNPNQVLRSNIVPLGVNHFLHNWYSFNPKIDIFDIFIDILLHYHRWLHPNMNSPGKWDFYPWCLPGGIQTEEISWEVVLWGFMERHYSPKLWNKNSSCLH